MLPWLPRCTVRNLASSLPDKPFSDFPRSVEQVTQALNSTKTYWLRVVDGAELLQFSHLVPSIDDPNCPAARAHDKALCAGAPRVEPNSS